MTRIGQALFGVLLVLLFFQIIVGFPMPLEQKTETPILATGEQEERLEHEQVMGQVHLVESREGERDWELFARRAVGSEGQGLWRLEDVKVQFYSDRTIEYVVTGKTGEIDSLTKDMKISGDVVTTSANGYIFRTDEVEYTAHERTLRSEKPVSVRNSRPGKDALRIRGNAMEASMDTHLIDLHDQVVATRSLPQGKSFSVRSNHLRLSGKNDSAKFSGGVRIEVDTLRIDGPEAEFEYRPGADPLRSVLISGGARVSDIDKYATAEAVRFEPEQNRLVLSGRPRVVQGQDEIVGEKITILNGGKKVRVEKMKARVEEERP